MKKNKIPTKIYDGGATMICNHAESFLIELLKMPTCTIDDLSTKEYGKMLLNTARDMPDFISPEFKLFLEGYYSTESKDLQENI